MFGPDNCYIDPIDFEQQKRNNSEGLFFETHIHKINDGKPIPVILETGFMYHKWSQFAPKANMFGGQTKNSDRNWIKIPINPNEINSLKLEEEINDLDDFLQEEKYNIFEKYAKLFEQKRSIYEPTKISDLDYIDSGTSEIKPKYLKLKFRQKWIYYYKDKLLDSDNSDIVKRAVYGSIRSKTNWKFSTVNLTFKNNEGKFVTESILLSDIEMIKCIDTALFYRYVESVPLDAKKVEKCSEDELIKYYGEPVLQTINTAEDMDKYCRHNSYARVIFSPHKIIATRNKDENGIREYFVLYVCESIDIIHIKQNYISKKDELQYKNYVFGKRKNVEQD